MRVNGEWLSCEDNAIRPTISGIVQTAAGQLVEVTFLLDAGADRTVFSTDFYDLLQPLSVVGSEPMELAGVGGQVSSITVETVIGFIRDNGQMVKVSGTFGVFSQAGYADLSVLGRDVTNNFGVIYDYPKQTVALLAPPHFYEIKS